MSVNSSEGFAFRTWRLGSLLTAAVIVACALIAACTSSPTSPAMSGSEPRVSTVSPPATALTGRAAYLAAQREWIAEGNVIGSAAQNLPLEQAITDLEHAGRTDSGRSEYARIIAVIKNLAEMPDAMVPPALAERARLDTAKIDKFFHLKIKGCNWPSARKSCWRPVASPS
jgi:hypothetical protein